MSKYIYGGDWKAIEGTNLAKTKIRDNLSDWIDVNKVDRKGEYF